MTDADLLEAAMAAADLRARDGSLSVEAFARRILGAHDGANARKVRLGTGALGRSSRVLCMLVTMRSELTEDVMLAVAALGGEPAEDAA